MTVQEFYAGIGGDYDEIISRLKTDERVIKFAKLFARDESYSTLLRTMEEKNVDEAFRAAHTMKGVCQNMAFSKLYQSSYDMTEALRAKDMGEAERLLVEVKENYARVMDGIEEITKG